MKKIGMKPHGGELVDKFGKSNRNGLFEMLFIETSTIKVHLDENGRQDFIDIVLFKKFDSEMTIGYSAEFWKAGKSKERTIFR